MIKITLLLLSFFTACNAKQLSIDKDTIVFSKFPKENKLIFQNFRRVEGKPFKFHLLDTTLIVGNDSTYLFYQYSLKNKSLIANFISFGRGKGAVLAPMSTGIYKNRLWVHDISLKKIVELNLSKIEGGTILSAIKEYNVPKFYYSIQLLDSLKGLGSGSMDSKYKLQEIDLKSGNEITEFGNFNNVPNNIPFYSWKHAYESFLYVKPTGNKALLACRYADQVEVFDLVTKKSIIIKGPENYEVEFKPYKANGRDIMIRTDKTRFAFLNGMATGKYVYLLYSGNKEDSKYPFYGKYIYVYDWNGKPIAKLISPHYLSAFAVSVDDATIYAYDIETGYIVRSKLNL